MSQLLALIALSSKNRMPSPKLQRYSTPPGFSATHTKGSQTIVFSSKEAFTKPVLPMVAVHYFSPEPVVAFRNLKRSVEVSHWSSSLSIEDEVELINNGPASVATLVCRCKADQASTLQIERPLLSPNAPATKLLSARHPTSTSRALQPSRLATP